MSTRLEDWVPRVYRFALRLTGDSHAADDLTQETLLRAWRWHTGLRNPQAIRSWLFRTAANLWRDGLRRGRLPAAKTCPLLDVAAPETDIAANRDDLEQALMALGQLPDRQRQVVYLVACEEMSIVEVAEVLNISCAAVKASLSLGRKSLRERLTSGVGRPNA